uniref:Taste receptor cell protein 1-like n=1 Tax=Phascolarctos cinereus TaxID=38626 RepID=A0A6P5L0S1_PHACI|nr:taste receptor cell protein 1-like [Phascolarctos cinereus]
MDSSPTSTVSLENFSSISSVSSSSTTLSVHLTATPTITPYLSWSHPSITESMDSAWSLTSVETELSMPSASSPAQYPLLLDSVSSSPGYNHVTRSLTFKITNEIFTVALYDPTSLVYRLLSENVQNQLTPIYRRAFSSFDRVEVGGFRLGSVAVNTTLVFGNVTQAPSPVDIVWVLYREAKGLGMMLGNLSLAENSIQSEASTLTTLAPLTVHVSFTTMELFESSLLIPGSATYTTLERLTMEPVTPVVLEFYGMHLQEQPLLFFSNDAQWVGVSIVYKFNVPVPVGLQGLADRLAREVRDTHIQKSSISVNEEKAELTVYNLWLRIPKWPFSEGLKDKASKESQELRGRLTHGLTTILKSTENFAEVIVEGFLFSPVIATVRLTYFKAAPSESDVQEWVTKGLRTLEDADGLYLELAVPDFDMPNSGPSGLSEASFPPYAVAMTVLGFLFLLVFPLILVLAFKTNLSSQIAGLCVWKPGCGRQVTASQYTMQSCDLKH